uniref:G_PROTEIN_RECEP_F1_2 domain-containing protein n=1 Tax=Syphacia muris TaxID=451379 RepID=A0A0N5B0S0_9BILA
MEQFSAAYHERYVRNWRVLGAIWVLFAMCSALLQVLVLIHPEWIGGKKSGYFGLYSYCPGNDCPWRIFQVQIMSTPFSVTAVLVLLSTVLSLLAVFSIMLLILLRDRYVFLLCSWMHLLSFAGMLGGCLVYPFGWDYTKVRELCDSGICEIKWAYALAIVLIVDQMALSMLGFILAYKKPPSMPKINYNYSKICFFFFSKKKTSKIKASKISKFACIDAKMLKNPERIILMNKDNASKVDLLGVVS